VGDDEQVIGFTELSLRNVVDGCLTSPVGFVEGLFVKSPFRGHGCGRQLVEFAAEWFKSRGCSEMATDAEAHNVEAQKFHENMGFTETYRIVEYRKALE
jgi:aminoglycoside 6'-N-acetyltransferase I